MKNSLIAVECWAAHTQSWQTQTKHSGNFRQNTTLPPGKQVAPSPRYTQALFKLLFVICSLLQQKFIFITKNVSTNDKEANCRQLQSAIVCANVSQINIDLCQIYYLQFLHCNFLQ